MEFTHKLTYKDYGNQQSRDYTSEFGAKERRNELKYQNGFQQPVRYTAFIISQLPRVDNSKDYSEYSKVVDNIKSGNPFPHMKIKFKLLDSDNNIVGYEYHEPNRYGIIQIYHESIDNDPRDVIKPLKSREPDHDNPNLFLVRKGMFIPHWNKVLILQENLRIECQTHT